MIKGWRWTMVTGIDPKGRWTEYKLFGSRGQKVQWITVKDMGRMDVPMETQRRVAEDKRRYGQL